MLRKVGKQQQDQLIQNVTTLFNNLLSGNDFHFIEKDDLRNIFTNNERSMEEISYNSEENPELMTITHSMTVNNETKEGIFTLSTSAVGPLLKDLLGEGFLSEDLPPVVFFLIVSVIAVPIILTVVPVMFVLGFVPLIFLAVIAIMLGVGMMFFMPFISVASDTFSWFFDDSDVITHAASKEDIFYPINDTTIDIDDITTTVTEFVTNVPRYFN